MVIKDKAENGLRSHVTSVKEDLMTGVSFMIPFVTIGGIFTAMAFLVESRFGLVASNIETADAFVEGTLAWYFAQIGGLGLTIMVPILGAYIAYAIADKPGLAPGFILSYAIQQAAIIDAAGSTVGIASEGAVAGFLGAIAAGLLAGYVAQWMKDWSVPSSIKPMMPILVIPVLTTALLAPVVILVLGVPIALVDSWLTTTLEGLQGSNAVILGLILGAMMAFDMGGPVNKVAYVFGTVLVADGIFGPMAAVMIGGMTPPLGLALANFVVPHKFAPEMKENAVAAVPMGLSFITEGAIPYAAADPLRVIPSIMVGSAVAAGTAMGLGVGMPAPHGGIFVIFVADNILGFLGSIALGTLVTAGAVALLKPDHEEAATDEPEAGATA
ncbi:PTS fructose transporter subunit IIC [Halorubrum laminariae]|uniref:PTS fructose transporter subunit IIC n=1 Tax=Halorubrum laminariae TaxID=1433523 RepID=A0ABD6BY86_9EURY|nr:PTS fructose transporter subunit IIC [Halorubrum laminariae]